MTEEIISKQMLEHILSSVNRKDLSPWESKFLISIEAWTKKGNKLSAKQSNALKKLWEKQTNPDSDSALK